MAETACAQEEFKFYKANVDPEDNSVLKPSDPSQDGASHVPSHHSPGSLP